MKNIFLIITLLVTIIMYSQNEQEYYVRVKENKSIEPITKITNSNGAISLTFNESNLNTFFSNKYVTKYERPFLDSQRSKLQRTYIITLENSTYLEELSNLEQVELVELVPDYIPLFEPNDYAENVEASAQQYPNRNLELIHAPEAFDLTHGDPNILVGVVDTEFITEHEELTNKIVQNFENNCLYSCYHGTLVAGQVAGDTNNGIGISSVGFNTKLVTYQGLGSQNMRILAQYPGVRVLNASWGNCSYNQTEADIYEEIWEDFGVIVVAAAGNGVYSNGSCGEDGNDYFYPASYDHTISVSSVGHQNNIGTTGGWWPSGSGWKDVHREIINPNDVAPNGDTRPLGQMHTHNDKVDIVTPGYQIPAISAVSESGYGRGWGTSVAAPNVAGACALILSVNPNLSPDETRNILLSTTDDIYWIPENQPYIGMLGTGRLNVYRAVKTAKCLYDNDPNPRLDLFTRNSTNDLAIEPDVETGDVMWQSSDIWIRNQADGKYVQEQQNPEYDSTNPNYVYVRVRNTSCVTSSGNDQLKLYWSKASTSLAWPQHWDGTLLINDPITGEDVLMGSEITTLNIPILEPGQETILEFEWHVPNPADYENINPEPWHFCLLSRIISTDDPMTTTEGASVFYNAINNNNIAWKNTTVVDIEPNRNSFTGGVIAVGNPFNETRTFSLELRKEFNEQGKEIFNEAEVGIKMDDVLFEAWNRGGKNGEKFKDSHFEQKKIVTDDHVIIDDIQFEANEMGTLYLSFNFLSKEITEKDNFIYHVIQRDLTTNEIIGGETYHIKKKPKENFIADAGSDKEIDKNEVITISAEDLNEIAIYNWYDEDGTLIYTGKDLTVSPEVTKKYKLEIISSIDGFKDYDEIEVKVNPYSLQTISPNPASSQVTINYKTEGGNSAYLMLTNTQNGISNNHVINTSNNSTTINISNYAYGIYSVTLICDGQVISTKNLIIQ